jgi:hypothetical protein
MPVAVVVGALWTDCDERILRTKFMPCLQAMSNKRDNRPLWNPKQLKIYTRRWRQTPLYDHIEPKLSLYTRSAARALIELCTVAHRVFCYIYLQT